MGQLEDWFRSWVPDSVLSAGGGRGSVEAWYAIALDFEEVLTGATDSDVHLFVADVVEYCDVVDGEILDRVLSSVGLLAWFRNAYFEYHACIDMIPKADGDASPLGQRPLCVLAVVYRFRPSAQMFQLEEWFRSWVLA